MQERSSILPRCRRTSLTSGACALRCRSRVVYAPRMSIRIAKPSDLTYIIALAAKNADALGFLTRAATENYIERRKVTLARENGDPCGFLLTSARDRAEVRIFQACVQYDARGLRHGIAMLSGLITEAASHGAHQISLHCRDGLASNAFWQACGLHLTSIIPGGHTRRRVVNVWTLPIHEALHLPTHPYAADAGAAFRMGAQGGEGAPREEAANHARRLLAAYTGSTAGVAAADAFHAEALG